MGVRVPAIQLAKGCKKAAGRDAWRSWKTASWLPAVIGGTELFYNGEVVKDDHRGCQDGAGNAAGVCARFVPASITGLSAIPFAVIWNSRMKGRNRRRGGVSPEPSFRRPGIFLRFGDGHDYGSLYECKSY